MGLLLRSLAGPSTGGRRDQQGARAAHSAFRASAWFTFAHVSKSTEIQGVEKLAPFLLMEETVSHTAGMGRICGWEIQ